MIWRNPIALIATLLFVSGTAFAQSGDGDTANDDGKEPMSICQLVTGLEDKGYTRISSIDRDLDRYEVMASAEGQGRVYMIVDGRSGEVLVTRGPSE